MSNGKLNISVECSDCAFSDGNTGCKIFNDVPMVCENYLDKNIKDNGLLDNEEIF